MFTAILITNHRRDPQLEKVFFLCLLLILLFEKAKSTEFTLEFARTHEQHAWGLMQRHTLPENHGMLFIYPRKQILSLWMFNCFTDLSAAFLDEQGIIQEIHELKSYPEKMDPRRPVHCLEDLSCYPKGDPILQFFLAHKVSSIDKVKYALEMRSGWFAAQGVRPGDAVLWDENQNKGEILPR